ncbi:MAG: WD40 repeat domain-containing protein, partial [Pedococcus sp.]
PDGRTLAVGGGYEAVLVDTATLKPRAHLTGQGETTALAFSPDGTHLAASGDRLMVWDLSGEAPLEVLAQEGEADDPGFSRDGKTLYTATFAGLVQTWDLAGDRRFLPAAPPGDHLDWAEPIPRFSPDLRKIGYTRVGPEFRVRDVATGKLGAVVAPTMTQANVNDIAWHPDGTTLNITSGAPVVGTWNSTTGRQITQRPLGPPGSAEGAYIAWFSLDGKYLLVGTNEGRLHVLDARTLVPAREPIQVYKTEKGEPLAQTIAAFRPSGDLHTVWMSDAIVDYMAGTTRPMPDLGYPVVALYPSPDGRRLLVNAGVPGVGLLDATTMKWIARPSAAQVGLVGDNTKWSDDGSLVASVNEGHLSYWDGRTGAALGTATVLPEWGGDPAFSKDDKRLLFAGFHGSVLTWDLDPTTWVSAACRLAGRALTEQEWRNYLPDRPFIPVCAS